jgi:ketosteroid isomerase-like protein
MRGLVAAEQFYRTYNKKTVVLLAAIFILLGSLMVFPDSLSVPKTAKTRKEIQTVMVKFSSSYRRRDIGGIMALYSNTPDTIALGIGKSGECIGQEAIRKAYQKEFSEFKEIKAVEYKILSLFVSGEIASLAADMRIFAVSGRTTVTTDSRVTAVLKRTGGKWFFRQTHFSSPSRQLNAGL